MNTPPNAARLFSASSVALVVTAMTFAIRGGIMSPVGKEFGLNGAELGWAVGAAFWGFTLAMVFAGTLCDVLGMGRLFALAFAGHVSGIALTILASGFWSLFLSTLLVGVANGLVEATSNPLVATLYPEQKTTKLNRFHAWFPFGIVVGGLVAYGMNRMGLGWRIQVATILAPIVIYGWMFLGQKFPETERVASGVSTGEMFAECLRPLFLFMIVCMLLTSATENGTNQWIAFLLQNAGVPGILVLVWVTGLMVAGRMFAGPVVHRLSPTGMLLCSAVLSALGLYWLGYASGSWTIAAAAVFAVGVCYFWPTMLGFVSERLPKTGALGLAVMGAAGMLATSIALPIMGAINDRQTAAAIPHGTTVEMLRSAAPGTPAAAQWAAAQLAGGSATLGYVAVMPAVLVVAFTFLILQQRNRTG